MCFFAVKMAFKIKDVLKSYGYSFENGTLSIDKRRDILTLIPKEDKDRILMSNLRTLSLLNYKLLVKIIAERMKLFFPKLIDPDQTGYVAGRFIGENLRLIADIITFTSLKIIQILHNKSILKRRLICWNGNLFNKHWFVLILIASSGNVS